MKNSVIPVALGALFAMAGSAAAADVTLPKGTSIEVRIVTPFDSDHAVKGKTFAAAVLRPLYVGGRLVIPKDAVVMGEFKHVRSPKDGAESAAIVVKFETLQFPGRTHDIEGVLTSFQADERKKILEQEAKLTTGRKVQVIFIGKGSEPTLKADTLVGLTGEEREELADGWALSGLGPAFTSVPRDTVVAMRLDNSLSAARSGRGSPGGRRPEHPGLVGRRAPRPAGVEDPRPVCGRGHGRPGRADASGHRGLPDRPRAARDRRPRRRDGEGAMNPAAR